MMRITTWNSEWATPTDSRGMVIRSILHETQSDVIVLTEGCRGLLPDYGHVIEGSSDWGYKSNDPMRRKVIIWTSRPIYECDIIGHSDLPTGRFASGITELDGELVRIIGVCIPWSGAHVHTGRRDRKLWQDHNSYLKAFRDLLCQYKETLIVAGDFNQRIPRHRQPADSFELLTSALAGMSVHTEGLCEPALIDHIATTQNLAFKSHQVLPNFVGDDRLTDHVGAAINLAIAKR